MHDVMSKSPLWGYASRSNSRGLPDLPPTPLSGLTLIGALPSDQCHSSTTAENSNYLDILEINLGRSEQQKTSTSPILLTL